MQNVRVKFGPARLSSPWPTAGGQSRGLGQGHGHRHPGQELPRRRSGSHALAGLHASAEQPTTEHAASAAA